MNISTLKRAILLCRAADITPWCHGIQGIGKSSAARNLAIEEKLGFVDFRLAQCEASDIRGMPDRVNGRTVYLPPAEMPIGDMSWETYQQEIKDAGDRAWEVIPKLQPRLKEGILFLDEINRGGDDILNAVFQLVYDLKIGQYSLPPGWSIVAAGNFMEGFMTNGFTDPAFLDRFCHLTLSADESTQPEWVEYMEATHTVTGDDGKLDVNYASKIIEFAAQNTEHLYGRPKSDLGFAILPSPRSWDAVTRVEKVIATKDYGNDARRAVIAGLIGVGLADSFINYNCPVRPEDLIAHGVEGVRPSLDKIARDENCRNMVMGLMWGVAGRLRKNIDKDEKLAKVAMDFTRWLCLEIKDKDIAVAFCNHMMSGSSAPARLRSAMLSNPNVGKLIAKWSTGKSFHARLSADPKLADLVAATAWGKADH